MDLFSSEENKQIINLELPDADIQYVDRFIDPYRAKLYFNTFLNKVSWQQDTIKLFGKTFNQPRLTALYGSEGKSYSYSGITMKPTPFTPELIEIKKRIEKFTSLQFNAVLLNLYRDGNDSNGWHSDDEKELGDNPVIASVSLGAGRQFQLKHKIVKHLRHKLELENGSLLLMKGTTQKYWKHQIPKTKKITSPRINLTFRYIY